MYVYKCTCTCEYMYKKANFTTNHFSLLHVLEFFICESSVLYVVRNVLILLLEQEVLFVDLSSPE